jgi:hypothetical protein
MAVATFDFTTLVIKAQDFVTMDAGPDIYSEWKRLLQALPSSLRMGAPPAFDVSVGGNPIGGGQSVSPYFFVRNDLGWRIEPAAGSGELTIQGNLFPFDLTVPAFQADTGGGTVLIRQQVSPQSITDAGQLAALSLLNQLQLNKLETDPVSGTITLYDDDDVTVLLQADLFEDVAGTQPYRGRGAERRNRMT